MANQKQTHLNKKQYDFIVYMVDRGLTQKKAAEMVGVNEATAWRWKNNPDFLAELDRVAKNKFRSLGAQSIGVLESLMENAKDDNIKLKAADLVSERAFGKVANKVDATVTYTIEDVLAAMKNGESENADES